MIWVIGCKGMLGSDVTALLKKNNLPFVGTDKEIDITDYEALKDYSNSIITASYFPSELNFTERQIHWIINCAAYKNMEEAETEPEEAFNVNSTGALNVARISREIGAKLIHISTPYVFDGNKKAEYSEEDEKNPLSNFAKSKAEGEISIQKAMNTYYIIRTSWLYGTKGNNLVYKLINKMKNSDSIDVAEDQISNATLSSDLAAIILMMIEKSENAKSFFGKNSAPSYGIYNFTNSGNLSLYEFASEIYKLARKEGILQNECKINPVKTEELNYKAVRPLNSTLNKSKILKTLKFKNPYWKTNLEKFMKSKDFNLSFIE